MSSNWNFRTILDIYPESESFACVSINPDNSSRCQNRRPLLSDLDLAQAALILDTMDRCDTLKTSYEYLDDLARLTLCIIHSEVGREHVGQISGRWQEKIMEHMKAEVGNSARPKTRRSIGRRRTSSTAAVMTVLKEEKEEQSPATAKKTEEIWKASVAQINTTQPRPIRNMSRKITTLISEVGFQDATNEQFLEMPKEPSRAPPIPPPRRLPARTKTQYPPVTRTDEWSSYPLLSLLSRSSTFLKSDLEIEDQSAEVIAKQIQAPRERANTASSTGSSTSGSKSTSVDSESGSSAPTSRSSSTKSSPVLGSEQKKTPFPPLTILPSTAVPGLLSESPQQLPLPTFDFGIFQSLPLPPGHKQSISNDKELTPVSSKKAWAEKCSSKAPPRPFEDDQSRPSFSLQGLEKPASKREFEAPPQKDAVVEVKHQKIEASYNTKVMMVENVHTSGDDLLPECDTVSMIRTSWIKSSRLSRSSSMHSSRNPSPSPPISRTSSFSLSRGTSLSRKASPNRLPLAPRKPTRTASFSLSRTLSRSLSRRSSKTSPKIDEETISDAPPSRQSGRTTNSVDRGSIMITKDDGVPLNRLIQMSHDLARRLDGIESTGYAKVEPTTSYKYRLPSAAVRNVERNPEMRFSKLFMGLNSDMNSFPYVSANFPFSIPIPRKPVAYYEPERGSGVGSRSKSVGNNDSNPREIRIFVRPAVVPRPVIRKLTHEGMQVKIPTIRKLTHEGMQVRQLAVPPKPPNAVEVCAMCGNTQTIWGRCDCGTPGSAKGKVGSMPRPKVVLGKMQRRPTKRVPKRGSTLRRIRKRVVRAFSI